NTFSRIAVYPQRVVKKPYSWGLSSAYAPKRPILERMIDIDGVSETPMNYFDGTRESVEHLRYDVTMIAHYLRENAKVFVIGVGGGRDIVAGKVVFNQKKIVGAEINNRILEMVNIRYGAFTGHIDKLPGVEIINDEGRNAITRYPEKFDIIQASCIATWSATSAGAFSLAENTLYTVEAWRIFMDRLEPNGILSFNRWYSPDYPAQLMRLASLASYTLKQAGVEDPSKHIAIVRNRVMDNHMPSGTILVSKSPFSETDIKRLREVSAELEFILEYDPNGPKNNLFEQVIENAGDPLFHARTILDLTPPTDDRPFFFFMLRAKDILSGKDLRFNEQRFSLEGITMLAVLLAVSIALCIVFILGPLFYMRRETRLRTTHAITGLIFFGSIGFGYILVEIGQLQRLIIFLGHPIYSITVVLFSMLLSSGIGALTASSIMKDRSPSSLLITAVGAGISALLLLVILYQPTILGLFEMQGIYTRILISLMFLLPLGFLMGLPFPMGMTIVSERMSSHTPWFWAINGATSVVASVASVCISIAWGFTATLSAGLSAYVFAALALYLLKASIDKP
ncbi:MAG: hypothetical protein HY880_05260, partial [Deltaproteobacteria bacterium]|nr:hypothetical protein [Deltaproteobacteria bacterium]